MPTLDKIDIPPEAREPKLLDGPPDDALIRKILDYIRAGGKPHLCPWHTHTTAPKNAVVEYVEEYTIPKSKGRRARWGACPCCNDCYPWYRKGLVAWFPFERVVRLVGPDCFKRLNPEAHQERITKLRRDKKRKRKIDYLLSNIAIVDEVRAAISANKPIADGLDAARGRFVKGLEVLRIRLWDHVRDGQLKLIVEENGTVTNRKGETRKQKTRTLVPYASIRGQEMFDAARPLLVRSFAAADRHLAQLSNWREFVGRIHEMSDLDRAKIEKALRSGLREFVSATDEMDRLQSFFRKETLATLRAWTRQPGCPCEFGIEISDTYIVIVKDRVQNVRVDVPAGVYGVPRRISALASSLSIGAA